MASTKPEVTVTEPPTTTALDVTLERLIAEGEAELRERLAERGLAVEAPSACLEYNRAMDAIQHSVLSELPDDLDHAVAVAYVLGRIAMVSSQVEQNATTRVTHLRSQTRSHWQAAIEAERRRQRLRQLANGGH